MSLHSVTIGSTAYDAYADVVEADIYLAVELTYFAAWDALSDEDKNVRLIAATRYLDGFRWAGEPTTPGQATEWPRSGLLGRDGEDLATDSVPRAIENATILLAADLAIDSGALSVSSSDGNVQSERIGPKAVTFFRPRRQTRLEVTIGNRRVHGLVRRWLFSARTPPVVSGTDRRSAFEPERFGRSEGIA